jgi:hypothetical protein
MLYYMNIIKPTKKTCSPMHCLIPLELITMVVAIVAGRQVIHHPLPKPYCRITKL